ncbi:MAG: dipeptide epimerase [Tissierellaceae bacterium]|nr:dipeptide epimerase [Tissierellaceae bacterium]
MKIKDIQIGLISVPLKKPFKTALRTVDSIEDIVVKITTDTGHVGYGEAAPTAVITGDTLGSIRAAIEGYIKPQLLDQKIENLEEISKKIDKALIGNGSAKAAVDIAIYDLFGQYLNAPLYKVLGGYRNEIISDLTISVNSPEEMARDSMEAVNLGYRTLKIKVGLGAEIDLERIKAIREAVGYEVDLRLDANQGWKPKEAVRLIRTMEDKGYNIELIEQPVFAKDIEGLKYVTDNVHTPILADEAVFSPRDAMEIIQNRAADLVNIKLMKTGGIHNALRIISVAEMYDVECMIGCMLESKLSVSAAVHLAAAKSIITKIDLDGPLLCKEDPFEGGPSFRDSVITLSEGPGLGFKSIGNMKLLGKEGSLFL